MIKKKPSLKDKLFGEKEPVVEEAAEPKAKVPKAKEKVETKGEPKQPKKSNKKEPKKS